MNARVMGCLMVAFLFFAVGAFAAYAEDPAPPKDEKPVEEPKPTPEQVDQAIKDFNAKYKTNLAEDRIAAVETLIGTKDTRITQALCSVLKGDKDETVRIAAVKVMMQHKDPNALATIMAVFKACKAEQMTLAETLAEAMGAFADKRAVDTLSSNLWQFGQGQAGQKLIRGRIAALGEIRDKSSIDALIRMMWAAGRGEGYMAPFMGAFRQALVKLTHLDFGGSRQDWQNWWSKNKNTFVVPKDPPKQDTTKPKRPGGGGSGGGGGGEPGGGETEPPDGGPPPGE